jgi:hypothetical protein
MATTDAPRFTTSDRQNFSRSEFCCMLTAPRETIFGAQMMTISKMREAALTARDAHLALLELKQLVDSATKKIHCAELEMVGAAIARSGTHDPVRNLRAAADALQSPAFEAAISQARTKMSHAVACQAAAAAAAKA